MVSKCFFKADAVDCRHNDIIFLIYSVVEKKTKTYRYYPFPIEMK